MKHIEKGFGALGILFVILMLSAVVGIGFVVVQKDYHTGNTQRGSATDAQQFAAAQKMLGDLKSEINQQFANNKLQLSTPGWLAENTPPGTTRTNDDFAFKVTSASEPTIEVYDPEIIQYVDGDGSSTYTTPTEPFPVINKAVSYIAEILRSKDGFINQAPPVYNPLSPVAVGVPTSAAMRPVP
jgi:hypothetical protein